MANDFPNIRALGLEVVEFDFIVGYSYGLTMGPKQIESSRSKEYYVRAADLETLLAKGVRVWQRAGDSHTDTWFNWTHAADKYQALLIGIEPVKRETAEVVLREMIADFDEHGEKYPGSIRIMPESFIERARKVVGK